VIASAFSRLVHFLASFGLACLLLINLFLLTFFGTLYQVEGGLFEAQKRYFESWIVVQRDPIPLVMPGGLTCMGLLAINLFLGGLVRVRKSKRTIGVIVVHIGIALLLASGFVKLYHSHDGHLTLYEGEQSDEFQSYYLWEVAIWDASQKGPVEEHLIPHEHIVDLVDGKARTFTSLSLPFEIELSGFLRNCQAMPKGPMWQADSPVVDGYALKRMPEELEAERNLAGVVATLRERGGPGSAGATGATKQELLWGVERHPATFEAGGKTWALSLRHTRYPMPFAIKLEDFRKEDHPGMTMARAFESDVVQTTDGVAREVRIQMNEPLRDGGLVLFQSSWGPSNARPGDRLFSVFSVVRNPSDHWPLYACIVIGVGLLLAFIPRLAGFVRAQGKSRAKLQQAPG
jgi:hypothetical protein